MVKQCFIDCIKLNFKHNEIHPGEMICQNRCYSKYTEALEVVKEAMEQFNKDFPDA